MRVLTNEFILKDEENVLYFFLYSGCSGPTECYDMDGLEDVIVPVDALDQYGNIIPERTILDYVLRQALVVSLPSRCKLVAVFDTCHSGTLMDLYHHGCNRAFAPWNAKSRRIKRKFGETWSRIAKRICSVLVPKAINAEKHCADVICISSCRDREHAGAWDETSLDSGGVSVAKAMLDYLKHVNPTPTYQDLMRNITDSLQTRNIELSNNLELSSGLPLRMNDRLRL